MAAMEMPSGLDERILILAPIGHDAALACQTLCRAGLGAKICLDVEELRDEVAAGTGAILLTQEALSDRLLEQLFEMVQAQPPWSDLPLVILVSRSALTPVLAQLSSMFGHRGNATFLERPVKGATLVNALQVSLRARRRQYELRDHLLARARAEEAERRARLVAEEAVRVRDEFLASVAHDLKNPLGVIKGHAQLLQRRAIMANTPETVQLAQGLAKIDTMVAKAVAQIDELLDLARLQANQQLPLTLQPGDLVALTRRVAAEYQQMTTNHQIRVETDAPELCGVWDLQRLDRVLGNLLSNAIKYSPEGGKITVAIREEAACALLIVQDQGIGIPVADLPHIFERFYRASNSAGRAGSGLGLAGVRQIVEQHGGTITVASEEGQGSCFTVRQPIAAPSHLSSHRP
ncbi:MAG: HAMP domain-containing histidine kinase [Chloroflexota bacterium]|nr:HAMP domain-containing histidine kinase [Chloroflexota bacterium]